MLDMLLRRKHVDESTSGACGDGPRGHFPLSLGCNPPGAAMRWAGRPLATQFQNLGYPERCLGSVHTSHAATTGHVLQFSAEHQRGC
ncbi:hypothetical protein G6F57_020848 [Rhizopus arrhizus]|nr:hypothetical protein G6F57_020848 [Rhizopus arrhizus]